MKKKYTKKENEKKTKQYSFLFAKTSVRCKKTNKDRICFFFYEYLCIICIY